MAHLHMRISELLEERDISKNRICKDLDIPRTNFNKYCNDECQRLDVNFLCKLCGYFECQVGDIIVYVED